MRYPRHNARRPRFQVVQATAVTKQQP
jgi:hypothetical protein